MYLPKGIKDRATGSGSLFVGGAAALSVAFGAAAFGLLGVGICGGILLLLFFVEVYREASYLSEENNALRQKLETTQERAALTQTLEAKNTELEGSVEDLLRRIRQPAVGLEEILEGIAIHLSNLGLVKAHRRLRDSIADAPITRLELRNDNTVAVLAVCTQGCEQLSQQFVTIIETASSQIYGSGEVVAFTSQGITAQFDMGELPVELSDELETQGSLIPHGYILRLAGLCVENYCDLQDDKIDQLEAVLSATSAALSSTLSGSQTLDASALLSELETGIETVQNNGEIEPNVERTVTAETSGDKND